MTEQAIPWSGEFFVSTDYKTGRVTMGCGICGLVARKSIYEVFHGLYHTLSKHYIENQDKVFKEFFR